MYVLDTNTLIYFFRGAGNVAETLFSKSPREVAIPAVVVFELERGIIKSSSPRKRRRQFNALLEEVRVLAFDVPAAKAAAELSASLERAGQPIGPLDTLIAGTALSRQATLVTNNEREFARVRGLRLENWFDD